MITVENLHKTYPTRFGEKEVLSDVNFELRKGEKLGILGRNGAGKSTLIRLISGAEFPTKGRVRADMSVSWPLAFGGAFQENLTGVDNVRFISRIYAQDFESNLAFVEEFSELGAYLREEVRTYSSGMRARLAFAISMITEFDCFLIDEISAVGDARFHDRCNYELFEKRNDRAMVIVSHDPSYISDHCDRFAILNDGRMTFYSDFDEAYGLFRNTMGLAQANAPEKREIPKSRKQLIEYTHTAAMRDELFQATVFEADIKGKAKEWERAEALYREALERQPYQRSYWVQVAHMAKEAGYIVRAESAYRTACALGEPLAEVEMFVEDLMQRQNLDPTDYPIQAYVAAAAFKQPPANPDIELLCDLCWGNARFSDDETCDAMRHVVCLDELLSKIIADPRFEAAHKDWLSHYVKGEVPTAPLPEPIDPQGAQASVSSRNLVSVLALSDRAGVQAAMATELDASDDRWALVQSWGGFGDWPQTVQALKQFKNEPAAVG